MVVDKRGIQNVFNKDSILASHPVYVSVHHPDEINEIFDLISYAKVSLPFSENSHIKYLN